MGPMNTTMMTTTHLRDYDVDGMGACTEVEVGGVDVVPSDGGGDGSGMGRRKRRWDNALGGTSHRFEDDDNDDNNDNDDNDAGRILPAIAITIAAVAAVRHWRCKRRRRRSIPSAGIVRPGLHRMIARLADDAT
jgi:hypothetical protein